MSFDSMDFNDLWELYGLKANPFSTSPLLVRGGVIPIQSFIGRKSELGRLIKQLSSKGGSRILVVGDVGVGKTSFVNVARYKAIEKGYFSPFKEIGMQANWDSTIFVSNTLYAIYSTLKLQGTQIISEETYNKLKNLVELNTIQLKGGGVSIAGFGGHIESEKRESTLISFMALFELFEEIIKEIYKNNGKETIIHYNNLERLPEKNIRKMFEDLRDFFQTPHVHFVFIGNLIVQGIFQSMPRLSSIISDTPILLNEMSLGEIQEILDGRLNNLSIGKDLRIIKPYQTATIQVLYELYGGNIRNILNSLSTAIIEATNGKPIILDPNSLGAILKSAVEKRYLSKLPPNAKKVLKELIKYDEITNKHLATLTKIARSNISKYLADLQSAGCVYLKRKDGKDKYWATDPSLKWLRLKSDERQKTLTQFDLLD